MDKVNIFARELSLIQDERIRAWVEKAVNILPDYFFTIPASSTGKYHPKYALGEGGLVRHTKAAVQIALELFTITTFDDEEKDIVISSLILHDGAKHGLNHDKYARHDHPLIICEYLQEQAFFNDIPQSPTIINAILSHMGQWNTSPRSNVVLVLPETKCEKFVHMCDYLASRKCLEVVV